MSKPVFQKKFLIVDDDADDVELFSEALMSLAPDTICYCANDGQEALEKLRSNAIVYPDIIFLDINMPGMNGWECLVQLKSKSEFSHIPVIIHTTSSRKTDKEIAKDLGALCFFTKHNDFKILKQMLEIVITKMVAGETDGICAEVYKNLNLSN